MKGSTEKLRERDLFAKRYANLGTFVLCLFIISFISCKKNPITPKLDDLTRPVIWLNSFEIAFTASELGGNPSGQILKIKNSGQKTLNYTVSDDAEWLSVTPANGSSSGQILEHAISVNKAGLSAQDANYTATITITSSEAYNNPQKVTVSLKITKEPPPEIWIFPPDLSFSGTVGGSNSSPQSFKVKNSGKGTLNYGITWDASWISISPNSGSSGGQEISHVVSVNIAGLGEGTQEGTITVSDQNAPNSPQKVKVTLKLSKEPAPEIWLSTDKITFKTTSGQNPGPDYLGVMNRGGGTLSYQITWDASWLSVNPASGSSTGKENNHTVSANAASLGAGNYIGTITIAASNATNSPQRVSVTLEISGLPTDNEIWPSCSPGSGGTGTTVNIPISIKGNINEINTFGLDLTFDSNLFQYQGTSKGNLTGSWGFVDGNLTGAGTLKIGGLKGSGSTIAKGSTGSIAVVTLIVIGTGYSDGYQSQISISGYTDDIAGMKPEPSSATFTFRK